MTDSGPPEPPPDLHSRALPLRSLPTGRPLYRIHRTANAPKYFGRSGLWRFDAPDERYGVLYAGLVPEVSFAEALLRGRGSFVAESELALRALCRFSVLRPLRLARLYGRHMARIGANALVTSGPYATSRRWSGALWSHPASPDGVLYRSTHDNDELAVALFDRAAAAIDDGETAPLPSDPVLLGRMLDHYGAAMR